MTAIKVPTTARQIGTLIKKGEGPALEFKRSTGELKGGMQTLCAFLNDSGGLVLFGVRPDGTAEGQEVSDHTIRDIAQAVDRFEPPAHVSIHKVAIKAGRQVVVVAAEGGSDFRPFTYEGHPFERVGSTTRRMPQAKYERRLVERGHALRRWENLPAEGVTLKDLDRQEILRTRELAIQQNRISPDTSRDVGDVLDRLGLRVDGVLTQAAQVLYGTKLLGDYPQCLLKLGRFRGTAITGDIVDNRQEHMHAFAMVREGMAFLERTMPLGARFPKGTVFREDRFPIPLEALREILLNAVMHRDYSQYWGYVAIVVFDDRVEIVSFGDLPSGVTLEQLSGPHLSRLRNPLIAEAFHRTGAVEVWGRGTNRVIEMCQAHGVPAPSFAQRQGFLVVTFPAEIVGSEAPSRHQVGTKPALSQDQVVVLQSSLTEKTLVELATILRRADRTKFRDGVLRPLIEAELLRLTIPDRPRSPMQKYQTTESGIAALDVEFKGEERRSLSDTDLKEEPSAIERAILERIAKDGRLTRAQVVADHGLGADQAKRVLAGMARRGLLEQQGQGRGAYWVAAQEKRAFARLNGRSPISGRKAPDSVRKAPGTSKTKANGKTPGKAKGKSSRGKRKGE